MFRILLTLAFFLLSITAFSQKFGGFKPSKQWQQLENENYRLIYSPELAKTAKQVAGILSRMNDLKVNIGDKRRNINIILQNSTTQANGYVGLAPFVSEFFLTPYPNSNAIGSLPWHYTLAIHEYQHALQYANSYSGISKLSYYLGGETLWSVLQSLAIPNWFFEGNAVLAETQYTKQGRGRIPSFFNGYRAFVLENRIPNYDKARNGSIQDFVPNHYPLGYLMVKYGRKNFGENYWANVLKRSANYKGIIYPFSQALKKEGGNYSRHLYAEVIADFSKQWNQREHDFGEVLFIPKKKEVLNFAFPTIDKTDGSLYFMEGSYDRPSAFYQVKDGRKERLTLAGIRSNNFFDVNKEQLLFTQTYWDKRWDWIDYEDIVIFDVETKKRTKLTTNGKYFHPAFSKDGKEIIAQYSNPNGDYEIHFLNAETGEVIRKPKNRSNLYITNFHAITAEKYIGTARNSKGQMALVEILTSGTISSITPWTYHIIGRPTSSDGVIYFHTSFDGVDNLYSLKNEIITQLSFDGPGRYTPIINGKTKELLFTEFTTQGLSLKKVHLNEIEDAKTVKEIPKLSSLDFYNDQFMLQSEQVPTEIKVDSFSVSNYSNKSHLINFHSWVPEISQTEIGIGLTSDNVLNTLDLTAAYSYNLNELTNAFQVKADYGQYFLHGNALLENKQRAVSTTETSFAFDEFRAGLGLSLPLNLTNNKFSRRFKISSAYNYVSTDARQMPSLNFHVINSSLRYSQVRIKAKKNIFSSFGINSVIIDQRALNKSNAQFLMQNTVSLPGLFQNNNFVIEADAQLETSSNFYQFSNQFFTSRGYKSTRFKELYRLSGNYHFPIAYPDKGALGIFYVQRIRGNIFYDYTLANIENREFNSAGLELIFDTRILRLLPVSLGIRYATQLSQKSEANTSPISLFIPVTRF